MLTQEDHEIRKTCIGGSDVSSILCPTKNRTSLSVYLEKKGLKKPFKGNKDTHYGNMLEDFILDRYAEETEQTVTKNPGFKRHGKIDYLGANIDGITSNNIVVDAKNVGLYGDKGSYNGRKWGVPGTNQMPEGYLLQIAHYCMIWDAEEGHMAPYFGGSDLRIYSYKRNEKLDIVIQKECQKFWENHILTNTPPKDVGTLEEVQTLWRQVKGDETITSNPDIDDLCKRLADIQAERKRILAEEETLKTEICRFMEDKSVLMDVDGKTIVTWKQQSRSNVNLKALREAYPDIVSEFIEESSNRIFSMKL